MAKLTLGPVRFSYCHLDEPYDRNNDGNRKYSVTLLIPKDDAAQEAKLRQAVESAKREGLYSKFGGKMPTKVANPIHDGDGQRENGEDFGEECRGHFVLTVTTREKNPPQCVVGPDRRPAAPGELYSGCYGYASINIAPYNYNGKKGLGAYLNNVWKTRDGEPLGGARSSAADDFAGINADFSGLAELYADDDLPF